MTVPLDHQRPQLGSIRVYFEFYPSLDRTRPAVSTVLSIEGGPGYSTTADRWPRIAMWKPLAARRNLLLVDLRGTGRSGALGCAAIAHHILDYAVRAGQCGRELGPRRVWYDTSQSVQDLESVLVAIGAGRIDLYGDSYGSYAAQAFALRYPWRLRSVVLDSTYFLPGTDPDWADLAAATRLGLIRSCSRAPTCPVAPSQAVGLIERLVAAVGTHPITGMAPDANGNLIRTTIDTDTLVQLLQYPYAYLGVYRDVFAAARSALAGDTRPLLRLVAETATVDGPDSAPPAFSEALYLAVICHDYPQPWPVGTPIPQRPAAAARLLASYPPGTFAPFDGAAWTGTDYEGVMACRDWPASPSPADPPNPPGAAYPHVPVLILSGDLDNITPTADAAVVASRFPDSTMVVFKNSNHVVAEEDQNDCGLPIYLHFVETLTPGDTSCAARIAPLRVVARFPLSLAQVTPAMPAAGNRAGPAGLRLASAAAQTVADAIQRWWVNYSGVDRGLRGGRWSWSGWGASGNLPVSMRFDGDRFVPGVAVSGRGLWDYTGGGVRGLVTVTAPGGLRGRIAFTWSMQGPASTAVLTGSVGGRALRARMPAP